jgi:hypothetical protein
MGMIFWDWPPPAPRKRLRSFMSVGGGWQLAWYSTDHTGRWDG